MNTANHNDVAGLDFSAWLPDSPGVEQRRRLFVVDGGLAVERLLFAGHIRYMSGIYSGKRKWTKGQTPGMKNCYNL